MKKLLTLHEAIVIALINFDNRQGSFYEIADFIDKRELFTERKGGISLTTQVMLRATKSDSRYHHLFEQVGEDAIRLRNLHNTAHPA